MTPDLSMPVFRCAIYFAPAPDSPWGLAGSRWLGRCSASGDSLESPAIIGVSQDAHERAIAEPRRYGWHATLKAPFRLAAGRSLDDVWSALKGVAQMHAPFSLPPLDVVQMDSFLALRPAQACPKLQAIAQDCVTQLHPFAMELDETEIARRRRSPLSAEQDRLLIRWGYPWVMDQFRFHFSLTGDIQTWPISHRQALSQAARAHFADLPACEFNLLSIFIEPEKDTDFKLLAQMELGR